MHMATSLDQKYVRIPSISYTIFTVGLPARSIALLDIATSVPRIPAGNIETAFIDGGRYGSLSQIFG
jgi:hypothetical protein